MFMLVACLILYSRLLCLSLYLILNCIEANGLEMYRLFLHLLGTSNSFFFCTYKNVLKRPVA